MLSQALKKDQGIIEVVSLEEITKNILQKFHDEDLIWISFRESIYFFVKNAIENLNMSTILQGTHDKITTSTINIIIKIDIFIMVL